MDPLAVLIIGSVLALVGMSCAVVAIVRGVRRSGVGRVRFSAPGVRGWFFASLAIALGTLAFIFLALDP